MRVHVQDEFLAVKVWDAWVRIFHWSLVASIVAAYFFTEDGDVPHEIAGYIALGLVIARIVWGFVGTGYARFAQFAPSLRALRTYIAAMASRQEPRFLGHNPAGGMMVITLLVVALVAGISGWMMTTDAFWGEEWLIALHKTASNLLMVLAGVHVTGVIYTSWRHRENLIRAMITGRKSKS